VTVHTSNGIDDRQQGGFDQAHGFPAILTVSIPSIESFDAIRVKKYSGCILKADAMFAQVFSALI
jgi:hypothetical protein